MLFLRRTLVRLVLVDRLLPGVDQNPEVSDIPNRYAPGTRIKDAMKKEP